MVSSQNVSIQGVGCINEPDLIRPHHTYKSSRHLAACKVTTLHFNITVSEAEGSQEHPQTLLRTPKLARTLWSTVKRTLPPAALETRGRGMTRRGLAENSISFSPQTTQLRATSHTQASLCGSLLRSPLFLEDGFAFVTLLLRDSPRCLRG